MKEAFVFIFVVEVIALKLSIAVKYFKHFFSFRTSEEKLLFIWLVLFACQYSKLSVDGTNYGFQIITFVGIFLALYFATDGSLLKKWFHYSFFTSFVLVQDRLAKFFYWISIKYEVIFFCCTYIAIIIFSAILLLMVLRFKIESDIEISEKEYFWLSLTPTITVLVIQLNLIGNSGGDLAITLGFFVNNLAMIELYNFMNEKSYIMQLRSLQRSEESFYEDFIHRTKDIALVQHDLKNIMLGMGNQSNAKDIERGLLNGEMPSLIRASQNFSGNLIIDSILSRKCLEMDEKQIGYSVTSQVPCDLNLKDCEFDIWSILGNVLDNAIEACEGIGKSKRKIKMTFKFFRGRIIFKVENSCKEGTANYNADKVVSGKEEGRYGLGLKSIKEKVVKKGGFFDFRCKGEQFHSLIVYPVHLNNEENV